MSGERVDTIKERAAAFLGLARELVDRGRLDIASFNVHQACQLRVKASVLRLLGEMPRIHSIRELLGVLAKVLEELDYVEASGRVVDFARGNREILIDIESAYTESRYGLCAATRRSVDMMIRVAEDLFSLLEEVEESVLG